MLSCLFYKKTNELGRGTRAQIRQEVCARYSPVGWGWPWEQPLGWMQFCRPRVSLLRKWSSHFREGKHSGQSIHRLWKPSLSPPYVNWAVFRHSGQFSLPRLRELQGHFKPVLSFFGWSRETQDLLASQGLRRSSISTFQTRLKKSWDTFKFIYFIIKINFIYLLFYFYYFLFIMIYMRQFSSVQSLSRVQLFATPWISAHQASLSITNTRRSLKLTSIESVMPSSHLILCRPLLLLPPIPLSIRVFSNESTLRMRWPKYWSFSFSIIPSNEHPGPISFRMDWLDLLAV